MQEVSKSVSQCICIWHQNDIETYQQVPGSWEQVRL